MAAAFGRIAGNIFEFAFAETGWTLIRDCLLFQYKSAFAAFPECLPAGWANIVFEFRTAGKSANRTFFYRHGLASYAEIDALVTGSY